MGDAAFKLPREPGFKERAAELMDAQQRNLPRFKELGVEMAADKAPATGTKAVEKKAVELDKAAVSVEEKIQSFKGDVGSLLEESNAQHSRLQMKALGEVKEASELKLDPARVEVLHRTQEKQTAERFEFEEGVEKKSDRLVEKTVSEFDGLKEDMHARLDKLFTEHEKAQHKAIEDAEKHISGMPPAEGKAKAAAEFESFGNLLRSQREEFNKAISGMKAEMEGFSEAKTVEFSEFSRQAKNGHQELLEKHSKELESALKGVQKEERIGPATAAEAQALQGIITAAHLPEENVFINVAARMKEGKPFYAVRNEHGEVKATLAADINPYAFVELLATFAPNQYTPVRDLASPHDLNATACSLSLDTYYLPGAKLSSREARDLTEGALSSSFSNTVGKALGIPESVVSELKAAYPPGLSYEVPSLISRTGDKWEFHDLKKGVNDNEVHARVKEAAEAGKGALSEEARARVESGLAELSKGGSGYACERICREISSLLTGEQKVKADAAVATWDNAEYAYGSAVGREYCRVLAQGIDRFGRLISASDEAINIHNHPGTDALRLGLDSADLKYLKVYDERTAGKCSKEIIVQNGVGKMVAYGLNDVKQAIAVYYDVDKVRIAGKSEIVSAGVELGGIAESGVQVTVPRERFEVASACYEKVAAATRQLRGISEIAAGVFDTNAGFVRESIGKGQVSFEQGVGMLEGMAASAPKTKEEAAAFLEGHGKNLAQMVGIARAQAGDESLAPEVREMSQRIVVALEEQFGVVSSEAGKLKGGIV